MPFLSDYFKVTEGKTPVVELTEALYNDEVIQAFVPVESTREVFTFLKDSMELHNPNSRAVLCHGAYGSGKSYIASVVCRLLRDGYESPALEPIWERMRRRGWEEDVEQLSKALSLNHHKSWLIVPIHAIGGADSIANALLRNLKICLTNSGINFEDDEKVKGTLYSASAKKFKSLIDQGAKYPDDNPCGYSTSDDLLNNLENDMDREAYVELKKWYKRISYGSKFEDNLNNSEFSDVEEMYIRVADALAQHNKGGILVVWDEFGAALEEMLKNKTNNIEAELQQLQIFIEKTCNNKTNKNNIIFMGFSHVSFGEYGEKHRVEQYLADKLKMISGRFREPNISIHLNRAEQEGYHLLSGMISPTDKGKELMATTFANFNCLASQLSLYKLWDGMDKTTAVNNIIKPVYPFHPATATVLLNLSDAVAQVNRTAFYYMVAKEKGFLAAINEKQLPDIKEIGSSELIRIHELFLFFEENLKENSKELLKAYTSALSRLPNDMKKYDLAMNVLRCILLLAVSGTNITTDLLAFVMFDASEIDPKADDLKDVLEYCSKAGAIYRDAHTELWSFSAPSINIDDLVEVEIKNQNFKSASKIELLRQQDNELLSEIFDYLGDFDLPPSVTGVIRKIKIVIYDHIFLTCPVLNPALENPQQTWNSTALYITLPSTLEEKNKIMSCINRLDHSEEYFVVPQNIVQIETDVQRFIAVHKMLLNGGWDVATKQALESEFLALRSTLRKELNKYYGNKAFAHDSSQILQAGSSKQLLGTIDSWSTLFEKLKELSEKNYSQCIKVLCGEFNGWSSKRSKRIENVIERVLDFKSTPNYREKYLGFKERSQEAAIIDGILLENKYLKSNLISGDEYFFDDYSQKTTDKPEVINDILKYVRESTQKRVLNKLFVKLIDTPYGIPNHVISILIAVAIKDQTEKIKFFDGNKEIVRSKLAKFLSDTPMNLSKASLRYENISTDIRKLYMAIASALNYSIPQKEQNTEQMIGYCKDIVDRLCKWANGFSFIAKTLDCLTDEERNFFSLLRGGVRPNFIELANSFKIIVKNNSQITTELKNATIQQNNYPQVNEYWQSLNSRITEEISGAQGALINCISELPHDIKKNLNIPEEFDEVTNNVDNIVSELLGIDSRDLQKEHYNRALGKLEESEKNLHSKENDLKQKIQELINSLPLAIIKELTGTRKEIQLADIDNLIAKLQNKSPLNLYLEDYRTVLETIQDRNDSTIKEYKEFIYDVLRLGGDILIERFNIKDEMTYHDHTERVTAKLTNKNLHDLFCKDYVECYNIINVENKKLIDEWISSIIKIINSLNDDDKKNIGIDESATQKRITNAIASFYKKSIEELTFEDYKRFLNYINSLGSITQSTSELDVVINGCHLTLQDYQSIDVEKFLSEIISETKDDYNLTDEQMKALCIKTLFPDFYERQKE